MTFFYAFAIMNLNLNKELLNMAVWEPILKSASCIKKLEKPILTKADVPYEAELVFNAGVAKIDGKYVMAFRNDYGTDEESFSNGKGRLMGTAIGVAVSDDGISNWKVREVPLINYDWGNHVDEIVSRKFGFVHRLYDPRITVIDNEVYLCLAMDTNQGIRGCIAKANRDVTDFEIISLSVPDNRNMVLFPEKVNGYYYRLERPFQFYLGGPMHRFDLWISKSPDLKFWGDSEPLLNVAHVPFANGKVGPAAPPIKTSKGWLTTFHAVDTEEENRGQSTWDKPWKSRYCAGIMLLDLDDPAKIIGMSKSPLIAPELEYETDRGYRQNVIFPGGMILEDNGEVKIYYGASDTYECVATANVNDLIALCTEAR